MHTADGESGSLRKELDIATASLAEAKQQLARGRDTLRAVFDSTPDLFVLKDRESVYRMVNSAFCSFIGKPEEEILGKTDYDLFPEEDAALYVKGDAEVMATRSIEVEDWEVPGDGGRRWLQVIKTPVLDESGVVTGVLCSVRDVSQRKTAELELGQFFALIPDLACITSPEGYMTRVNAAWETYLGYTPEEMTARPFLELVHPDDREATRREFDRQLSGGTVKNFLNRYRAKDGAWRWLEWNSSRLEDGPVYAIARDVTERIELERQTRLWADAFSHCAHGIAIGLPLSNTILTCNEAFARMQGMAVKELEGLPILNMYAPEERERVLGLLRESDREGFIRYESKFMRRDGTVYPVQLDVVSVADQEGELLYRIATMQDISDRLRTQTELLESEERFRSVVESAPEGIFIQTRGCFSYLNRTALLMFSAAAMDDLLGKEVLTSTHPDFRSIVAERIRGLNEQRRSAPALEEKMLRLDGSVFEAEISAVPFVYSGEPGALVFMRDITERKKAEAEKHLLESQLFRSQKMESIGRLAGGVSHDLNNLLTPILGYSEMLGRVFPAEDRRRQYLDVMHEAALKARDLIRQLLAFSSSQTLEFRVLDLNAVVLGFEHLLRRTLRANIEIRYQLHGDVLPLLGDAGQLEQIIMNLAINSADAMPSGGELLMTTLKKKVDAVAGIAMDGVPEGCYAMLEVCDNGCGMDRETLAHVFEPFYTTKPKGKGTGLGLSTVYGIVRQHGGLIRVSSELGKGACFRILFPLLDEKVDDEPLKQVPSPAHDGSGDILVVEDDDVVRKFVVQTLAQQGYRVLEASGGEEALKLLAKEAFTPELLLTDLVMRGMNGKELYDRVKELLPGIRVVYMSGYARNILSNHGAAPEGIAFLQKPFTLQVLIDKVAEAMQEK